MVDLNLSARTLRQIADSLRDEGQKDIASELHHIASKLELATRPAVRLTEFPESFE